LLADGVADNDANHRQNGGRCQGENDDKALEGVFGHKGAFKNPG
jgi:hypothetical protein